MSTQYQATKSKVKLVENLKEAGHPLIELYGPEGGSALFLPFGMRILGLFDSNERENFFWVNPQLMDLTRVRAFFQTLGWKNSGGERTWIAPEVDLFIKDLNDPWKSYEVPPSLDPGNYSVKQCDSAIQMENRAQVTVHRIKRKCRVDLKKMIRMIANPLRYEEKVKKLGMQLQYVGYEEITILRLLSDPEPGVRLGIWSLTQVPPYGEVIIPTTDRSQPRNYFGEPATDHLQVGSNFIRLIIDGETKYKVGLPATSVIGRIGYLRAAKDGRWTVLIRNFFVDPSGEYVDVPLDDQNDLGYAIQCYNDDGKLGSFGEIEYHAPAIGDRTGITVYSDQSQVWAFRGEKESINKVCQRLLGVHI